MFSRDNNQGYKKKEWSSSIYIEKTFFYLFFSGMTYLVTWRFLIVVQGFQSILGKKKRKKLTERKISCFLDYFDSSHVRIYFFHKISNLSYPGPNSEGRNGSHAGRPPFQMTFSTVRRSHHICRPVTEFDGREQCVVSFWFKSLLNVLTVVQVRLPHPAIVPLLFLNLASELNLRIDMWQAITGNALNAARCGRMGSAIGAFFHAPESSSDRVSLQPAISSPMLSCRKRRAVSSKKKTKHEAWWVHFFILSMVRLLPFWSRDDKVHFLLRLLDCILFIWNKWTIYSTAKRTNYLNYILAASHTAMRGFYVCLRTDKVNFVFFVFLKLSEFENFQSAQIDLVLTFSS